MIVVVRDVVDVVAESPLFATVLLAFYTKKIQNPGIFWGCSTVTQQDDKINSTPFDDPPNRSTSMSTVPICVSSKLNNTFGDYCNLVR